MGAAYFIILDKPEVDAFVNGKALAREVGQMSCIAELMGIRSLDYFVSFSDDELDSLTEDFGVDGEVASEQWFDPDEGLAWLAAIRDHLCNNPNPLKDPVGVLSDLAEYEQILTLAKDAGCRWHLSLDY